MPDMEFFRTVMGHQFYESTVPRIATALERIATALETSVREASAREESATQLLQEAITWLDGCQDHSNWGALEHFIDETGFSARATEILLKKPHA